MGTLANHEVRQIYRVVYRNDLDIGSCDRPGDAWLPSVSTRSGRAAFPFELCAMSWPRRRFYPWDQPRKRPVSQRYDGSRLDQYHQKGYSRHSNAAEQPAGTAGG